MPDGPLEWKVPIVTLVDSQRRALSVTIEDGEVVVHPPRTDFVLPSTSADTLCEAVREAREIAQQMGRGLSGSS